MITHLAGMIRGRQISCVELVERSLRLLEASNPRISAVVALRAERAMEEAAGEDRRAVQGAVSGPLAGIPVLVKDLEDVAGMVTTQGSLLREKATPAACDGLVPARLRAAGAIVIGKTNLPEFAFEAYTANRLFGETRNPWDLRYSPGGSSGGSAAAMSAGIVPVATATDGGGSARIPAAFCGLVGLKPTNGIIGRSPIPSWMDLSTDGPMGHSIADVALLLDLEKGPVAGDPSALPHWDRKDTGGPTRVLAAIRTCEWGPLDPLVAEAFERALGAIERDLGLAVELIEPAEVTPAGNADLDWFTICCTEQAHHLGRQIVEDKDDRLDPVLRAQMQAGLSTSVDEYLAARRRRFEHARHLDTLLEGDVVLVTPTLSMTAQHADGRMIGAGVAGTPADALNTCVQNITGHPAMSIPAGRVSGGLPFGLQVTAPRFRDELLLHFGARWERSHPWPWFAPGFEPLITQP